MQNKNVSVFLILGAFVLGAVFFWVFSSVSKPSSRGGVDYVGNTGSNNNAGTETVTPTPDVPKLNSLNLSNQGLDKLPSYVLVRLDLQELNISNNRLTGALPSEIGRLKKLKILNASNNLMTGVPAEVGQLSELEVLDLSNNQLTGLPNELANLKKLKTLNLSGNNYSVQDLDVIRRGLSPSVNIIL
jgi:leucine-rich repeat protein SHOC2